MPHSSRYIVRQPIKDLDGKIIAYEIRYAGEDSGYETGDSGGQDFAAADAIYNLLTQNTDRTLKGAKNFMTFTTNLLMKQTPKLFGTEDLVIQVEDNVIIHPLAMRFVDRYAGEGYKIAVNEFQFTPRYMSILDKFDYIKLNFKTLSDGTIHNIVGMAHKLGKQCIATHLDDEGLCERATQAGVDAMEGRYVAEQLFTAVHTSSYLESNFFRLMIAITKDEPDVEEIEQIISRDATLAYSLLKMVNSAYFALRNPATDVRQAVMILGLGQLRQWIYLMGCTNTQGEVDDTQQEFLKTSLMRGTFSSELMKYAKSVPISRNDAYMMGMFSTLNHLIDAPLEEILAEIPVSMNVKAALLLHEGRAGMLYDLILGYERADWPGISRLAEELGIPMNLLTDAYFKCMEEVNTIWAQLMEVTHQTPVN